MPDPAKSVQKQFNLFDSEFNEPSLNAVLDRGMTKGAARITGHVSAPINPPQPQKKHSKFIVYVDESGDHGMQNLDPNYPIFVLAFCVFNKQHYTWKVVPAIEQLKFQHFGHDLIVLHEHEIRKGKGDFNRFSSRAHQDDFISELTNIIESSNFILISCIVDKKRLQAKQGTDDNPYHLALGFCLDTLYDFLVEKNQDALMTHVIVERRGKKEDNELELEFRRMCAGANKRGLSLPFDIVFADKKVNSSGLQLADLVARPVGMSLVRTGQENRAFDVLKRKFYCSGGRANVGHGFENWGLKIHPAHESEKPR